MDETFKVIAAALDVDVYELRALVLEGSVPPLPAYTMDGEAEGNAAAARASAEMAQVHAPTIRATLAVLEANKPDPKPLVPGPITFARKTVDQPDPIRFMAPDMSKLPAQSTEEIPAFLPNRSRSNVSDNPPVARPRAPSDLVYLMSGSRYLHESCTGLTDDLSRAWRQPRSKVEAVFRKFPDTIDYIEVPA